MPVVKIPVSLAGAQPGEAVPGIALYALVPGKPPERIAAAIDGSISIDPAKLKGRTLVIGADGEPPDASASGLMKLRADQVLPQWARAGLVIPRERWLPLLFETVCVSGDVRKCRPWFLDLPLAKLRPLPAKLGVQAQPPLASPRDLSAAAIRLPVHCLPVCDGVVEIHERVCCCTSFDWRDLVDRLRDLLDDLPVLVRWPDPPIPDPGPRVPAGLAAVADLRRLAPRQSALPARPAAQLDLARTVPSQRVFADYQALLRTRPADVGRFIEQRPYLSAFLCRCSSRKVGEVTIQPSGEFDFCYRRPRRPHAPGQRCFTVFGYRVRQRVRGSWITIYDGIAGQDWFAAGETAHLRTSHPLAQPCGDGPPPPDDGDGTAFVMLEHVGAASTRHFNFPVQTGLSNMANLAADSGLIDFGGVPDCPWGGGLGLRLWASEALDGVVVYYRLKALPVGPNGDPAGPPVILDGPVSWERYISVGGETVTTTTSLAAVPADVGGEIGLYRMPYWTGGMDWLSGQYHQIWDTTSGGFADGKYLLVLELFGPGGARIKPASAPAGDPGTARPFQLRRWTSQTVTENVPFADCGHVFWINNRPVTGDIVDLRKDGVPNSDECQFLSGPGTTSLSVGFRAFHLNGVTTGGGAGDTNSFMAGYSLTWQRGLNGPTGTIETGTADQGETGPEPSNALAFSTLLGPHRRCTFSVQLHVDAKHQNGSGFINSYDYHETVSFALELT